MLYLPPVKFVFSHDTPMNTRKYIVQSIVLILFLTATWASVYLGIKLTNNSEELKNYKHDFFVANQIKDGFLNGRKWSYQVERIIGQKIDSFSFSSQNKQVLHEQVSGVMNRLLDQVDDMIHEKQDNFSDNMKMKVLSMLVNVEKVRHSIPEFASTVVAEIDKRGNRAEVKDLVKEKVSELLIEEDSTTLLTEQQLTIRKYHHTNLSDFNANIKHTTASLEQTQNRLGYQLIAIMVFILALWVVLIKAKFREAFAIAFLFSVLISFVNLYIGINLPMMEIDARIAKLDLEIMSSHIQFFDQILFYQSKSILDVATILLTEGKTDAIFVGSLILLFSVGFPAMKLIAATIYLFSKKKSNGFIHLLAFKSGKWSMADVMVIAIFIAYIGFQSIITNQLSTLNTSADETELVNIMTTNRSNLQIGFIVFVSFVLFNLFLAVILKRVTTQEGPTSGALRLLKLRKAYERIRRQRQGDQTKLGTGTRKRGVSE